MIDSLEVSTPPPVARESWANVTIRLLSVAAIIVSGYLLVISLGEKQLPVGCGSGSGCASVLSSRWSSVLGIPVGGVAEVIYLAVFVGSFLIKPSQSALHRRIGWMILLGAATAITGAAVWFTGLQLVVLKAICPWCMADHGLGLVLSILIFAQSRTSMQSTVIDEPEKDSPVTQQSRSLFLPPVCAGIAAIVLLAGSQILFEGKTGRTIRLPPGKNADTGPGPERQISVIDGKFQLAAHEQPVLGSPDSPKLLIVLFDYCCPHCRATHGYLIRAFPGFRGQLSVLLLPMPMDHKCNKTLTETEPRFEHACELARLALAVWRAKPDQFYQFDTWLFESDLPRDPTAARREAEELVGAAALQLALNDAWIDKQIAANVQAYADSGADRIPVMMSPGFSSIVGRPESEEELLKTLQDELKIKMK